MALDWTKMMRLGAAMTGSNADLRPVPRDSDKDSEGSGESEESESEESESSDEEEGDSEEGDSEEGDSEEGDSEEGDSDGDSEGDSEGDSDGESEDGESDGESEDGDSEDGDSEDGDSEDGDSEDGEAEDGDSDGDSEGDSEDGDSEGDSEDGSNSDSDSSTKPSDTESEVATDGGGFDAASNDDVGDGWRDDLLEAMKGHGYNNKNGNGFGILDSNDALKAAFWEDRDTDLLPGEAMWLPSDPTKDKTVMPKGDLAQAKLMRERAALLTAAIKIQFRRKFLAARRPRVLHGVKHGRDLSERRLVDTMIEIRSGRRPTRPDYKVIKADDCSLAVALVGDQSGSMHGRLATYAATAMVAVADAFDSIGNPVMACGVRDGGRRGWGSVDHTSPDGRSEMSPHRFRPVTYDLFKDWDEPMHSDKVLSRFAAYKAMGGTPLSDGLAFAIDSISQRPERHRVILVLTDGAPNNSRVFARLVRQAREAGIWVVGVGIELGYAYSEKLRALCPDKSVCVDDIEDLPMELIGALEEIVFPAVGGRRATLDASFAS